MLKANKMLKIEFDVSNQYYVFKAVSEYDLLEVNVFLTLIGNISRIVIKLPIILYLKCGDDN